MANTNQTTPGLNPDDPEHSRPAKQNVAGMNRTEFIRAMSGLSPADWAFLISCVKGASDQVSSTLPVRQQVGQLVPWADGERGPGLEAFKKVYAECFEGKAALVTWWIWCKLLFHNNPWKAVALTMTLGTPVLIVVWALLIQPPTPKPKPVTLDDIVGAIRESRENEASSKPSGDSLEIVYKTYGELVEWQGVVDESREPYYAVKPASIQGTPKPYQRALVTLFRPTDYRPKIVGSPIKFKGTFIKYDPNATEYGLAVSGAEIIN